VRRRHEAENATTFYFEPDSPLAYTAGQYLNYTLPHPNPDDRGTRRSFTLSSFPEEPLLSLTTRLSTPRSSFKTALSELEPGAELETNGPHFFTSGPAGLVEAMRGNLARIGVPRDRITYEAFPGYDRH
jgi:ferredoxin-NADP reductase